MGISAAQCRMLSLMVSNQRERKEIKSTNRTGKRITELDYDLLWHLGLSGTATIMDKKEVPYQPREMDASSSNINDGGTLSRETCHGKDQKYEFSSSIFRCPSLNKKIGASSSKPKDSRIQLGEKQRVRSISYFTFSSPNKNMDASSLKGLAEPKGDQGADGKVGSAGQTGEPGPSGSKAYFKKNLDWISPLTKVTDELPENVFESSSSDDDEPYVRIRDVYYIRPLTKLEKKMEARIYKFYLDGKRYPWFCGKDSSDLQAKSLFKLKR